jgi:hypothetical protein
VCGERAVHSGKPKKIADNLREIHVALRRRAYNLADKIRRGNAARAHGKRAVHGNYYRRNGLKPAAEQIRGKPSYGLILFDLANAAQSISPLTTFQI